MFKYLNKSRKVILVPKTIKVDALASEIMRLLHEYANDVTSDMKKDIDSVARGTVKKELRKKAPSPA